MYNIFKGDNIHKLNIIYYYTTRLLINITLILVYHLNINIIIINMLKLEQTSLGMTLQDNKGNSFTFLISKLCTQKTYSYKYTRCQTKIFLKNVIWDYNFHKISRQINHLNYSLIFCLLTNLRIFFPCLNPTMEHFHFIFYPVITTYRSAQGRYTTTCQHSSKSKN